MKFKIKAIRKFYKIAGVVMMLFGACLFVFEFSGITGFVVGVGGGWYGYLFSFFLLIGGVVVFMSGLENKIEIYKDDSKRGDDAYYLADPEGLFGSTGVVDCREFIDECGKIRDDPDLWQMTREVYLGPLIKIANSEGQYSSVAKKCLDALALNYIEDRVSDGDNVKRELVIAFRGWDGTLDSRQKKLLGKLGLKYEKGKPHSKIFSEYGSMPVPNSPSDKAHGGYNMASDIERLYLEKEKRLQER